MRWCPTYPYNISRGILRQIPTFGNPDFRTGVIILSHASSINIDTGSGYSNFFIIVCVSILHVSLLFSAPTLIWSTYFPVINLISFLCFFSFPHSVRHTPNIFWALSAANCFSDSTFLPEAFIEISTLSTSIMYSYFTLCQLKSTNVHQLLAATKYSR